MIHNEKKTQVTRKDPEMTQRTELVNKDIKTVITTIFNMVKKVEEILSMLNRGMQENFKETIADTFPDIMKTINSQIQESQQNQEQEI